MSNAQQLEVKFEELIRFIDDACIAAGRGNSVNMDSLDQTVAQLLARVKRSGGAAARDIQPAMARMISKLDELTQILSEQKHLLYH